MDAVVLRDRGEDGSHACELTGIILEALHAAVDGLTGGNAAHEEQDLLAVDILLEVVAEDHLVVHIGLRGDDSHVLTAVHAAAGLAEVACEECADHLGTLEAEDGVDLLLCVELGKLSASLTRRAVLGLGGGHIDEIVDMGVVGREVTGDESKLDAVIAFCNDLDHSVFHKACFLSDSHTF